MADYAELQIKVDFSGDAAEKVKDLTTEVSKFGSDHRRVTEGLKAGADSAAKLGTELKGVVQTFGVFGRLPVFSLAGGGIAGVLLALKKTNDVLGDFSREMIKLRDISRAAGLLPDQFKNIANQLKQIGYSTEDAQSEVLSFVRTVDEATRHGTAEFQRIWQDSFNPETTLARVRELRDMIDKGEVGG